MKVQVKTMFRSEGSKSCAHRVTDVQRYTDNILKELNRLQVEISSITTALTRELASAKSLCTCCKLERLDEKLQKLCTKKMERKHGS